MPSPYSWQPPPRPETLFLPDGSDFRASVDRTWQRVLWGSERSMGAFGIATAGWPDMLVSAHLDVGPDALPLTAHHIREALRLLRFEHPAVALRLASLKPEPGSSGAFGEPRLVYEVPTVEDVEAWLSDIIVDRSDALDRAGGDMAAAVAAVRREAASALPAYRPSQLDVHFILKPDGKGLALVVRFGHVAFDGIGAFSFLDAIVRKLATVMTAREASQAPQLAWGEEVARLPPPVTDNLRIPWSADGPTKETVVGRRMYESVERSIGKGIIPLYTPYPDQKPSNTGFFYRSLSERTVEALVRTARQHGCTIFSTTYAAAVLSSLSVTQPKNADAFVPPGRVTAVNLRHRDILKVDDDVPCAVGVSILYPGNLQRFTHDGRNPKLEEVWELAREVNAAIKAQVPEMATIGIWGEVLDLASFPPHLLAALLQRNTSTITSPTLSSLGVIDTYLAPQHGDITVSQPLMTTRCCMTGPPMGPMPGFHLFTWQGSLHVSVGYSEAVAGTYEEQVEALKNDPNAAGSLLAWFEAFMDTLERASQCDTNGSDM